MNINHIINFIIFNIVWFASVLGAAHGLAWTGPLALACFAGWQLAVSHDHVGDIRLLGAAALIGWIIDTTYMQTGLLHYAAPVPDMNIAPWWIVSLWLNFALILNHSLRWLQDYPLPAAILGAIGGPLAYYGGVELEAVFLNQPPAMVFPIMAAVWALATPLLIWVARVTRVPDVVAEPVHLANRPQA